MTSIGMSQSIGSFRQSSDFLISRIPGFPYFNCVREIICGAVSGPNPVDPIVVAPVWYAVSMTPLRMATSVSSMFSRVSGQSLVTCHLFSLILYSVSVKEFARISKNDPTSGAFVHSLVERRVYYFREMMQPECSLLGRSYGDGCTSFHHHTNDRYTVEPV